MQSADLSFRFRLGSMKRLHLLDGVWNLLVLGLGQQEDHSALKEAQHSKNGEGDRYMRDLGLCVDINS